MREEQRYSAPAPAEDEEPDPPPPSDPPERPEPSPQLERLMREEQRYSPPPSRPTPTPPRDESDAPVQAEPAPREPSEPVEDPAPARPQRYGVDASLYAHLPPEDQAAIRDGYERRTQPQPAEPRPQQPQPQPQPPSPQPQPQAPQPQPPQPQSQPPSPQPQMAEPRPAEPRPVEQQPLEPQPVQQPQPHSPQPQAAEQQPQPAAPEPSASVPTPSPDAADPPRATSSPVEEPAPARPQRYGVDAYLFAHLPPEDQAAIREGYERRTQPQPPSPQAQAAEPAPVEPQPSTAPEPSASVPTPSPDAADPPRATSSPVEERTPARPQRYGVDAYLFGHLPPEDQAAIREGHEGRRRPASEEAGGCTPVQGPYLNEADRPCVVPDVPRVPVGQIGTQPEPPASSEPVVEGVGSGGGGGGGGSWGGEEEDIVEDKPWWEDGLSAVGDAASWTGEQAVGVGTGVVEGVQGIGEGAVMLYRLSPTNAVIDNQSWREEWSNVGDAAEYAWENPGEFGQALINWEDIEEGRYGEWLGNLGPDALVAVATAGTGTAATATTRVVRSADDVGDLADVARDADRAADAADAARDADRAGDGADTARDADRADDAPEAAVPDAEATQRWLDELPTRPTPDRTPADRFEIEHTGPVNFRLTGGGESVWADGFRASDGTALEAKHVGNPDRSPYVDGSSLPEPVRAAIQADLENELQRYGAVIRSEPHVRQLEIITNEARSVPKFEELMERLGIPGQVRLVDD